MPRKDSDSYWFRFYPDKYLGGTGGFSFEMHGAYLILLLRQWESGPIQEDAAKALIGDLWDKIRFKFVKTELGYVNTRMDEESQHKKKISEIRTDAVLVRYKSSTIVEQKNKKRDTIVLLRDSSSSYSSLEEGMQGGKQKREENIIPPKLEWVKRYCDERGNDVDPDKWWDFYASKGWKVGKNPMKNWQAAVRTWEKKKDEPEKQDYMMPYHQRWKPNVQSQP